MTTAGNLDDNALSDAREMTRALIAHHFGKPPRRVLRKGGGLTNFVFAVKHAEGDFIVRINPNPGKIHAFVKEQWAVKKAREAGVPTPELLEVGSEVIPYPYMIARSVAGQEATYHPEQSRILQAMGRHAASLHSIRTRGYGSTFDWSDNQLSHNATWREFLESELNLTLRLETLEKHRMLSSRQIDLVRRKLEEIDSFRPALNHGDLRLKNVIADREGETVAIIDWEHAMSNPAPIWEFAIALHDLSIDAKQEFVAGYGLGDRRLREIAPLIKALNLINYAPQIEQIAEDKDAVHLDQYRTRLSGALDLYSL